MACSSDAAYIQAVSVSSRNKAVLLHSADGTGHAAALLSGAALLNPCSLPLLVQAFRRALPRPYIVTTAAWSIGAYGEG